MSPTEPPGLAEGPLEGQVPVSSPMQPSPGGMNQAYQEPVTGPYLSAELNNYDHGPSSQFNRVR